MRKASLVRSMGNGGLRLRQEEDARFLAKAILEAPDVSRPRERQRETPRETQAWTPEDAQRRLETPESHGRPYRGHLRGNVPDVPTLGNAYYNTKKYRLALGFTWMLHPEGKGSRKPSVSNVHEEQPGKKISPVFI